MSRIVDSILLTTCDRLIKNGSNYRGSRSVRSGDLLSNSSSRLSITIGSGTGLAGASNSSSITSPGGLSTISLTSIGEEESVEITYPETLVLSC
eukprot:1177210-Amorphochlora_amoeboformis.AAC.1